MYSFHRIACTIELLAIIVIDDIQLNDPQGRSGPPRRCRHLGVVWSPRRRIPTCSIPGVEVNTVALVPRDVPHRAIFFRDR